MATYGELLSDRPSPELKLSHSGAALLLSGRRGHVSNFCAWRHQGRCGPCSISWRRSANSPAVVAGLHSSARRCRGCGAAPVRPASLAAPARNDQPVYRRGHGESGDKEPHTVKREIDDIAAVLQEAGGSAFVYGTSGPGVLAMYAAAEEPDKSMKKLAIWEPPFFTQAVGMPGEFVAQIRQAPWWSGQESLAHTLIYDATIMGDYSLPRATLARIQVPTLVLDRGLSPWLSNSADAVAAALPRAQRQTIPGQQHNVEPAAIAPAVVEFFKR